MKKFFTAAVLITVGFGVGQIPLANVEADVTDAEAIRWTNEVVRPLAESMRALNVQCEQALAEWNGGINTKIPNDGAELIDDGRESEGVSRLYGDDINAFMNQVSTFATQMDGAGVSDVINLPCVRRLEVN